MSLVSEALRKARREADAQGKPGGPRQRYFFSGSSRVDSRLGTGLVLGAMIAFAAATAGGLVAWWAIDGRRVVEPGQPVESVESSLAPESFVDLDAADVAVADIAGQDEVSDDVQPISVDGDDVVIARRAESIGDTPSVPEREAIEGEAESAAPPSGLPTSAAKSGVPRDFVGVATIGDVTLTLGYLVYRPTDPFVQINGVDVRVGSIIEGFVIDEITRDRVTLHDDEGPVLIRVH